MGKIERIDRNKVDRDGDRAVGELLNGATRQLVTIEKRDGHKWVVVRGNGDDIVWECAAPDLDNFVTTSIVAGRLGRNGMFCATLGGFIEGGRGFGWRFVVSEDFFVSRPLTYEELHPDRATR